MAWFGKSRKRRKSNSKQHKPASNLPPAGTDPYSPLPLHSNSINSSLQLPLRPSQPWPRHHSAAPATLAYGPTQMVPHGHQASASTPYLSHTHPYASHHARGSFEQRPSWSSSQNLPNAVFRPYHMVSDTVNRTTEYLNRGAALCDQVASKFNDVISLMDEETFVGTEQDLRLAYYPSPPASPPQLHNQPVDWRGARALIPARKRITSSGDESRTAQKDVASSNVFAKATLYANSRVTGDLKALKVYTPTWPLLCLAARYSLNAYRKPVGAEKDAHVDADWRLGTKAMVIKSVPVDDMNAVVFAIRGTQTFMDWAVNFNTAPVSPAGFLDDEGNLCHSGFLDVARKMVKPVASRLRSLLEENPSRASCSLIITGHSAGGAVASLLFSHMLNQHIESELTKLTRHFKRVHCVTFGAPPVSLLPLRKPDGQEKRLWKYLFFSFINEGDPVTRADKAYVRSLLDLYGTAAPKIGRQLILGSNHRPTASTSRLNVSQNFWNSMHGKKPKITKRPATAPGPDQSLSSEIWRVPHTTLSNAGRCVILRVPPNGHSEDVRAYTTTDQSLRGVVFGDPLMHQMKLYSRRIEVLATRAATGRLLS